MVTGVLESIPAAVDKEAGYTLGRRLLHTKHRETDNYGPYKVMTIPDETSSDLQYFDH